MGYEARPQSHRKHQVPHYEECRIRRKIPFEDRVMLRDT